MYQEKFSNKIFVHTYFFSEFLRLLKKPILLLKESNLRTKSNKIDNGWEFLTK